MLPAVVVYLVLSFFLLAYMLSSRPRRLHGFALAIAISIVPFVHIPNLGSNMRMFHIPVPYIPILAASLSLFLTSGVSVIRKDKFWLLLFIIFLVYTAVTTFKNGFNSQNFAYYLAWPVNLAIFLAAKSFFYKAKAEDADEVIKWTIYVFILGCLVGIGRKAVGLNNDANFFPHITRNGTVLLLAMIVPFVFYLGERKIWRPMKCWMAFGLFFILIEMLHSRSGAIGFIFAVSIYHMRLRLSMLFRVFVLAALFSGAFYFVSSIDALVGKTVAPLKSGVKNELHWKPRLESSMETVEMLKMGREPVAGKGDWSRMMLILSAYEIFKNNFWFGTGLGTENYQRNFRKYVWFFERASLPHFFYLSYLTELGVIGFSLLVFLLVGIYRMLPPLSSSFRAFKVSFLTVAVMMVFNDFILFPQLWLFYGILAGLSVAVKKGGSSDKSLSLARVGKGKPLLA